MFSPSAAEMRTSPDNAARAAVDKYAVTGRSAEGYHRHLEAMSTSDENTMSSTLYHDEKTLEASCCHAAALSMARE